MRRVVKSFIDRLPYIRGLRSHVTAQGAFPAGHYYSPIPSKEDVRGYVTSRVPPGDDLPGIRLNRQDQHALLNDYIAFYQDLAFPEQQTSRHRYYYDNIWFRHSDAIFLYCFLRKHTPKRIIEIGSGFSSAVMLDTIDSCFSQRPETTFIDPYPDRLFSLLRENDRSQSTVIDRKIQEVPLDVFLSLKSGDLLFIDSSHVVKCGNDLHLLMFEILPRLEAGVFVHFHDVFYPFDYPSEWLMEGRYWNENYFLRAFLSWNSEWEIRFFNTYVHFIFTALIKEKMPLCMKDTGGSLYLQRTGKDSLLG